MAKIIMNRTADINDKAYINQMLQIIQNFCDANDMSMGQYAKAAGVSKAWISRISNEGNKHVSIDVAAKLLDVAGYSIKITSAGIEIGTRLRKLANHVGPISHEDVTLISSTVDSIIFSLIISSSASLTISSSILAPVGGATGVGPVIGFGG